MKGIKVTLAVAASALLLSSPAMAFHDGGVASCDSCHTMHNSLGGSVMKATGGLTQFVAGKYLLQGSTQSEACLNCHEASNGGSYKVSTTAVGADSGGSTNGKINQFGPGGDFRWLTFKSGTSTTIAVGDKAGHNIIAPAFGYNVDARQTAAPGATGTAYDAQKLACSSCHDPHGKFRRTTDTQTAFVTTGAAIASSGSYNTSTIPAGKAVGSYRILAGNGYKPKSYAAGPAFTADPPAAIAQANYNISENSINNGGGLRVAYGAGMSEWCGNCHGKMHADAYTSGQAAAANGFNVHPAGNGATMATASGINTNYSAYVTSGIAGGSDATAWTSLVPFEVQGGTSVDYAALRTLAGANSMTGPGTGGNVMCLSCHRAHATGFASMTRYNVGGLITVDDGAGNAVYSTDTVANGDIQTAMYGRPATLYGTYQRALCNKCHNKD
jgi:hypothetical protein